MEIRFYREPSIVNSRRYTPARLLETYLKIFAMLLKPVLVAILGMMIWKLCFYDFHIHVHKEVKEYIVAGTLPTSGLFYIVTTGFFLDRVIDEYKEVRMAIKRYDLQTFMDLRDEDVSPLSHAIMTILAIVVILQVMSLEYPSVAWGCLFVGGTVFIFSFIFTVIREIDNPFDGIWFIKNIHPEWMDVDCKVYRLEHYRSAREKAMKERERAKRRRAPETGDEKEALTSSEVA